MIAINLASSPRRAKTAQRGISSKWLHKTIYRLHVGLAALAFSTSAACAASASTECQSNLSDQSVDYGQLSASTLMAGTREGTTVSLGKRRVVLSIVCKQPTTLSVVLKGQDAGADRIRFSDRGVMAVRMSDAQLGGRAVELGKIPAGLLQPSEIGPTALIGDGQGVVPVSAQRVMKGVNFTRQCRSRTCGSGSGFKGAR